MSAPINDGGSAYPSQPLCGQGTPIGPLDPGMTLRDWFAGKALAGIMAHPGQHPDDTSASGVASLCYELADAMIAARKESQQ